MSCDLVLEITPGEVPGMYSVAVDSPGGGASGRLRLDAVGLLSRRRELAAAVLASAVTARGGLSAQEQPVREVGQTLFEAVFADRVYGRYTASVQEAGRRGEPLRVVLRLRAPELAGLPWETLFDPEAGEYLCQREPVVRYVETAQPAAPLAVEPPLRILGLVAAPPDLPRLDVAEERRRLSDAVADLGKRRQVDLVWASGGSWPKLQEILLTGPWHVLHFVGHGGIDRDVGMLALEDEVTGRANLVSAGRFARLLHACRPVPRLVVLNSCQSGEAAADDLLSSTAAALVHSGISAAVAMQFAVTDPAALAFARGFYQALAHNNPVDEAVRLGRIAIDGTCESTLEWVTPVLYLRTDETRLFTLTQPPGDGGSTTAAPPAEQAAHEAALQGRYVRALAALRSERYDEAITLFDSLLALDPDYRDAADRRDRARRAVRLAAGYQRARAAEETSDWENAIREYAAVAELDPTYRDAAERGAACRSRQQVNWLQEELREHATREDWQSVLTVSEELAELDPLAADVDGLASIARQQLHRQQQEAERVEAARQLHRQQEAERVEAPREQHPRLTQRIDTSFIRRQRRRNAGDSPRMADIREEPGRRRLSPKRIAVLAGLCAVVLGGGTAAILLGTTGGSAGETSGSSRSALVRTSYADAKTLSNQVSGFMTTCSPGYPLSGISATIVCGSYDRVISRAVVNKMTSSYYRKAKTDYQSSGSYCPGQTPGTKDLVGSEPGLMCDKDGQRVTAWYDNERIQFALYEDGKTGAQLYSWYRSGDRSLRPA